MYKSNQKTSRGFVLSNCTSIDGNQYTTVDIVSHVMNVLSNTQRVYFTFVDTVFQIQRQKVFQNVLAELT